MAMRNLGDGYLAVYRRGYWELSKDGRFAGNLDEGELVYEVEKLKKEEELKKLKKEVAYAH